MLPGSEFSFAFGNSINEITRKLCGYDFKQDEAAYIKEKRVSPPFFIIYFKIEKPFYCSSGYWKRDDNRITTYNCFPSARKALETIKNKIIPPLISSL